MTANEAKDRCPDVSCRFGGKVYPLCPVRGRRNQFATVYVPDLEHLRADFSWDAVARAATTGAILHAS